MEGSVQAFLGSVKLNVIITFMVGMATGFASYLALKQIPALIASALTSLTDNRF